MMIHAVTLRRFLALALVAGLVVVAAGNVARADGWATLTGRIVYDGKAPAPPAIKVDKDPEVCGKTPLVNEELEVGPKGGLKNAIVSLRTDKGITVAPEYEKSAKDDVIVDNKNCRFEPHIGILRVGQTLVIKNSDTVGHNTKAEAFKNTSFNDIIPAGQEIKKTWTQAETLPVKIGCSIHTWMGGYILVRSNPYAAVTDADGKFTIKDLPAGQKLEFQLWQEKAGFLKDAKNKEAKVDKKGRFELTLKPGENDLGDIVVSPSIFK